MLIIEKNAVYEVDCECLQKKRGRYANLTCEERQIEKEQMARLKAKAKKGKIMLDE